MARERGPAKEAGELRKRACAVVHCKGSADDCVHTKNFKAALAQANGKCKSCCRSRIKEVAWCLVVIFTMARVAAWLLGPFALHAVVAAMVVYAKTAPWGSTTKAVKIEKDGKKVGHVPKGTKPKVNYCPACHVQCNGARQMEEHLQSAKHKAKVASKVAPVIEADACPFQAHCIKFGCTRSHPPERKKDCAHGEACEAWRAGQCPFLHPRPHP